MRILETGLLLSEFAIILLYLLKPQKVKNYKWLLFLPLLLFLLHGFTEGCRWQMIAAYSVAVVLALANLVLTNLHLPRYLSIILSALGFLLIVISSLLSYFLPVFRLPPPSGSFAVGTTSWYLRDELRPEAITADSTDVRELMVQVWYPAVPEAKDIHPYMHPKLAITLVENYGLPEFVLSHFDLIQTHASQDVPVALEEDIFPTIIFSPGYMSHSSMYTAQLEALASHGYIILAIDYTYETPLSIFSENDLRFFNPEYTDVWRNASWDKVETNITAFKEATSIATKRQYVKQYLFHVPYTARVDNWTTDVSFVIDQLQSRQQLPDHSLFSKIDIDNIGAMGHSVGGATSAVACATDNRIKAGINLDGSQWGSLMNNTIAQPFLWITADVNLPSSTIEIDSFIYNQVSEGDFYHLSVAQATHSNFYDLSLWSKYAPLTQTGAIDGHKMIEITNRCSVAFFDKHLKGKSVVIEDLAKEFYELSSKK